MILGVAKELDPLKFPCIALTFYSNHHFNFPYPQAAQELVDLLPSLPEPESRALLPFWPRIYSRAAADHDRRVREAAQRAQMQGEENGGKKEDNIAATDLSWYLEHHVAGHNIAFCILKARSPKLSMLTFLVGCSTH